MKHLSVSILACLLLFPPLLISAQTNMLVNGGFESGETAWSGWSSGIQVNQTAPHSGTSCARFTTRSTLEQSPITVIPGKTYKLSAWIRINSMAGSDWGGIRFSAIEYNWSANYDSEFYTLNNRPVGEWFNEIISFVPTSTQVRIQAGFFGGQGWVSDYSFDDLVLFEEIPVNAPPVITSFTLNALQGQVPFAVNAQAVATDPDGAVTNYLYETGDGAVYSGNPSFSHTYRLQGNYTLKLTLTDDAGATDTLIRQMVVTGEDNHLVEITSPLGANGNPVNTSLSQVTLQGIRLNGSGDLFWINNRTMQSGSVPVSAEAFTIENIALSPGMNLVQVQSGKGDGTFRLDEVSIRYTPEGYAGPLISALSASKTNVRQYERTDLQFSVQTVADNPYFPYDTLMPQNLNTGTGISVDVLFTNGSVTYRQPAFLNREYTRQGDHLLPAGESVWTARMAFRETGTWSSSVVARDIIGETSFPGPAITVVQDSLNGGYIRVSASDNRYFEYENGRPFIAMGHGTSVSGPEETDEELGKWQNNHLNFGRFWLSPVSPFSDPWSSWATHHPMISNGYMPPPLLTYNQKYANGDFSYRIASPAVENINTPAIFRGFWDGKTAVEPGKQYRIIARVKTVNLNGNGGLVLKTGGWLGTGVTNPGTGTVLSDVMKGDNPWAYLTGTLTTGSNQTSLDNLYLVLEDCIGEAYLDQLTIQEINPDGSLKENILSKWNANTHYYLDPIRSKDADYLIDQANQAGIHYKIVIHEKNDYICNHLDQAGYVTATQGNFDQPSSTKLGRLYEYYWRNLIARWGYATSVHSWELVNEGAPASYAGLTDRLANTMDNESPYPRMVSTSFWSNWEPEYWAASASDYSDIHAYIMTTGWIDTITIDGQLYNREALKNDAAAAFYAYSQATGTDPLRNKPVILGETDLDMPGNQATDTLLVRDTAGVFLHNFNWAHISHGGITGLLWGTENIRTNNLYHRYKGFYHFMKTLPITTGNYSRLTATTDNTLLRVWGQRQESGNAAHCWIQNRNHTWKKVVQNGNPAPVSGIVTFTGLTPGSMQVERWNSWAEDTIASTTDTLMVNESGELSLSVVNLVADLAFKFSSINAPPPTAVRDWPQFQRDAQRTGRTSVAIPPPYRARWIWAGPGVTLRNQESETGWTDDLTSRPGYSFPLPATVNHTIAQGVQPVIRGNRLYFCTMEGDAYALSIHDGATLWSATVPGGSIVSAAVVDNVVVFAGLRGIVYAMDTLTGALSWQYNTRAAISTAPCVHNNQILIANHKGKVSCLLPSGALLWERQLGAPVTGGIAASGNSLYVPAENLRVYALDLSSGNIRATQQVNGQSFRMCHPVVFNGKVWVTSCPVPMVGSETVMDDLMSASASQQEEQENIRSWLLGESNNWAYSSPDWQHVFALDATTLNIPFLIPSGPVDGCGYPPPSVVVDNENRVLSWWKTRYPTLTSQGPAFGTNYTLDISGINEQNGNRVLIDNGQLSGMWPLETDNLYNFSVGGNYLWLRQNFRGTLVINLSTSQYNLVQTSFRWNDGGNFSGAHISYLDQNNFTNPSGTPVTGSQQPAAARSAPAIAGNYIFISEDFGIVAIETY